MIRLGKLVLTLVFAAFMLVACSIGGGDGDDDGQSSATVDEVMEIVTLTPAPSATVRTELIEYVVGDGDTLSGIASDFGTTARAIADLNGFAVSKTLHAGDVLKIPST